LVDIFVLRVIISYKYTCYYWITWLSKLLTMSVYDKCYPRNHAPIIILFTTVLYTHTREPGLFNELGRWILQLIQAYHQYGVGSHPAL